MSNVTGVVCVWRIQVFQLANLMLQLSQSKRLLLLYDDITARLQVHTHTHTITHIMYLCIICNVHVHVHMCWFNTHARTLWTSNINSPYCQSGIPLPVLTASLVYPYPSLLPVWYSPTPPYCQSGIAQPLLTACLVWPNRCVATVCSAVCVCLL